MDNFMILLPILFLFIIGAAVYALMLLIKFAIGLGLALIEDFKNL